MPLRLLNRRGLLACAFLMSISVGMLAATVSLFRSLVYDPIGLPGSDQVVAIGGLADPPPPNDPVLWWSRGGELSHLAYVSAGEADVEVQGLQRRARVSLASSQFFAVFGLSPFGSDFLAIADGSERVAVLHASFCRSVLMSPRDAVGSALRLGGIEHRVVGVVSETFDFPDGTDVWIRTMPDSRSNIEILSDRGQRWVGQLAPGASVRSAQAQLYVLLNRLNTEFRPRTGLLYGDVIPIAPLADRLAQGFRPRLNLLLIAGGLIFLGSIITSAAYTLGLGLERQREVAIRRAIGATEWRLIWELATEVLAVGIFVGSLGCVVALTFLQAAGALFPAELAHRSIRSSTVIDAATAGMVLSALITAIGMLWPRLWILRLAKASASVDPDRGQLVKQGYGRFPLVASQIALAFLASVFASESLLDYVRATRVETGYDDMGALVATVALPRDYVASGRFLPRLDEIASEIGSSQGARSVGLTSYMPVPGRPKSGFWVDAEERKTFALSALTSSTYFQAMKIPIVLGQVYRESDTGVVIIDERCARILWPDGSAVGKTLLIEGESTPRVIVGVTGPVSVMDTDAVSQPQIYLPFGSAHRPNAVEPVVDVVVRLDREVGETEPLRQALRSLGSDLRVLSVSSLHDMTVKATGGARAQAILLLVYALLSGGVALLGVLNVVAFVARTRQFEIGVRLALGARAVDVALLVAKHGAVASTAGVMAGLLLTPGAHKVLAAMAVGVGPLDMSLLWTVAIVGILAGACASFVPAIRAARQNPVTILRRE